MSIIIRQAPKHIVILYIRDILQRFSLEYNCILSETEGGGDFALMIESDSSISTLAVVGDSSGEVRGNGSHSISHHFSHFGQRGHLPEGLQGRNQYWPRRCDAPTSDGDSEIIYFGKLESGSYSKIVCLRARKGTSMDLKKAMMNSTKKVLK
jgi:hypothetical protein